MAPDFLADVYSGGRRGKDWAREWLRERQLLECPAARELIAVFTALDALLFDDATEDFINQIGTERLAKKALGIFKAYEGVRKEADWRRPPGSAAKGWKTKVDFEAQKRVDPRRRMPRGPSATGRSRTSSVSRSSAKRGSSRPGQSSRRGASRRRLLWSAETFFRRASSSWATSS